MPDLALASPEDQTVTFVELFFDLVFVFCVTQVVGLLHGGITLETSLQAVLAFWLVWWAWTQFTWALNAANTDHVWVQLATLLATAVAFFLAIGIPEAFGDRPLGFALPYVAVRVLGLVIYGWVVAANAAQSRAVRTFAVASIGGLVAVALGAALGGGTQYWLWGFAILLDVIAALVGGERDDWGLHADHFAERHGLIVIIALGETLIVAAGGVSGSADQATLVLAALAVVLTCGLWWSYFPYVKPSLERALHERPSAERAGLARDAYSLLHFPMLCGIIAYAIAVEEAIAHPHDPLPHEGRAALGVGLAAFVGFAGLAWWRATGRLPAVRLGGAIGLAVVLVVWGSISPAISLTVSLVGVLAIASFEHRRARPFS